MNEIIKSVLVTPTVNILVLSGIIFLFIAAIGNINNWIAPGRNGRIFSAIIGIILLSISLYFNMQLILNKKDQTNQVIDRLNLNKCEEAFCYFTEYDTRRIYTYLSDYFADPSRVTIGTTPIIIGSIGGHPESGGMNDMEFPELTGINTAKITGTVSEFFISVTDGSGLCSIEHQKANAGWNGVQGAGVYTKKFE